MTISTAHDAQVYCFAHVCAECGSYLLSPFVDGGWEPVCGKDKNHVGHKPKRDTKFLYDPIRGRVEYDVMSQEPIEQTTALAIPNDQAGMERRIKRAMGSGMFPQDLTPDQQAIVANIALAYGLDPLRGELIIYHGKPYMGIAARQRKDAENGHHPSIAFRFLSTEEKDNYKEAGAMEDGDLVRICMLTTEWGNTVEALGTSYARDKGNNNPSGTHRMEMADKRAEMRARGSAYGAIAPVLNLTDNMPELLGEGDDGNTVEGTATPVDEVEAVEVLQAEMDVE